VPDVGHVREVDGLGRGAQLAAQHVDLRSAHHDQRGLVALDPVEEEPGGVVDELLVAGVQQRLVAEDAVDLVELPGARAQDVRPGAGRERGSDVAIPPILPIWPAAKHERAAGPEQPAPRWCFPPT
jgi:hypothetical protein